MSKPYDEVFRSDSTVNLAKQGNPIGFKADQGKNRLGLVIGSMARAMEEIGRVATFGASKYTPDGWLHVDDGETRYKDALLRHLLATYRGEERDHESGLQHLAHAAWCAIAVLDLHLRDRKSVV